MTLNQREEGQIIIILALVLVILLGFAGLALDGGMIYADRRHEQNVADAAAMAGAGAVLQNIPNDSWECPSDGVVDAEGDPDPITGRINRIAVLAAKANALDNGFTIRHNQPDNGVDTDCNSNYYYVVVTITQQTKTSFLQLIYNRPMVNVVHAIGKIKPQTSAGAGHAIISLNFACSRTGTGVGVDKGLGFNGDYDVDIINGTVSSNSCIVSTGASGVVNFWQSDESTPLENGGEYVDSYIPTGGGYHLDPPPVHTEDYEDIFIEEPDCSSMPNGSVISTTTTSTATISTISPGIWRDISARGGAGHQPPDVLILQPGLYCVERDFTVDSDTKVYGEDITIVMMGTTSDFKITGSPHVELAAPLRSDPPCTPDPAIPFKCTAVTGLLIYSNNNKETKSSGVFINGDSTSEFTGTIYAPRSYVTVGGNVNDNQNRTISTLGPIRSQIIGLNVIIHGTPNLKIIYDEDTTPVMAMRMQLDK